MPDNEIIPVNSAEVDASVVSPNPVGLNDREQKFCELFAVGQYAGHAVKCYEEAFGDDKDPLSGMKAHILLSRPEVQRYLSEISNLCYDRTKYMKEFLNTTLMSIAYEMAHCEGAKDRNGNLIPPSSCRCSRWRSEAGSTPFPPRRRSRRYQRRPPGRRDGYTGAASARA